MHGNDDVPLITIGQKDYLKLLCWQKKISTAEICQLAGVRYLVRMPRTRASEMIDLLKTNDGHLMRRLAELHGQLSMFGME